MGGDVTLALRVHLGTTEAIDEATATLSRQEDGHTSDVLIHVRGCSICDLVSTYAHTRWDSLEEDRAALCTCFLVYPQNFDNHRAEVAAKSHSYHTLQRRSEIRKNGPEANGIVRNFRQSEKNSIKLGARWQCLIPEVMAILY